MLVHKNINMEIDTSQRADNWWQTRQ